MKKIYLFFAVGLISALLTACGGGDSTATQTGETIGEANAPAESAANSDKKKSEYPPIPSAIAQSEIESLEGGTFKLEDKKGKVVLVNLWATWCGPCRAEMPHLVEMQETFGEKGFEIVGLDVDPEPADLIKEFAEEMKLNYQLAWADRELVGEFYRISQFDGIPQTFLIDRDGNLRGVFTGGSPKVVKTMRETVEKLVSES